MSPSNAQPKRIIGLRKHQRIIAPTSAIFSLSSSSFRPNSWEMSKVKAPCLISHSVGADSSATRRSLLAGNIT
jgi:hypothetical protein